LRRTVQVRLGTNTLRLPGGTPILVVSRQQCMKYPGQGPISEWKLTIIQPTTSSRKIIVKWDFRFRIAKKRGNSWLIFTCDWLKIVLNKNDLIKGYCYKGKIAKSQLPI
ncbi:MAG: hypothetical protein DRG34_01980, partial [Deltaproteobacteria bacterium]